MNNIEEQFHIEKKYSRQNIREWMLKEFAGSTDKEFQYQVRELIRMKGKDYAVELLLIVLRTDYQSIQSVVSQLASQYKHSDIFQKIDNATIDLVAIAEKLDLFDIIIKESETETGEYHEVVYVQANFSLGETVLQKISDTLYIPPMICPPRRLYDNTDSAYLTRDEHVILKSINQHDGYQALDALNIINAIPLCIDLRMLSETEEPKKALDTQEKRDNFSRMRKSSDHINGLMLKHGNVFYFDHRYGKRGRMYENTLHLGIQKNTHRKGMIRLANAEVISLD